MKPLYCVLPATAMACAMLAGPASLAAQQPEPSEPASHATTHPLPASAAMPLASPASSYWPEAVGAPLLPTVRFPGVEDLGDDAVQQRRQTMRGLRIGALVGGLAGAGVGTLMALWCSGTSDPCLAAIPVVTVLGVASGAAAGAIIGAAIPADDRGAGVARDAAVPPAEPREPREPRAPATGAPAPGRRIGSASLTVGYANASIADESEQPWFEGGGSVIRANVYAELKPWFAIGPDLGAADFGDGGSIRWISVGLRSSYALTPALTPFVSAHAGAYESAGPSLEYFGGGAGAGIRITPATASRFFIEMEGRLSRNLQNIAPMRMRTLALGGGLYW